MSKSALEVFHRPRHNVSNYAGLVSGHLRLFTYQTIAHDLNPLSAFELLLFIFVYVYVHH